MLGRQIWVEGYGKVLQIGVLTTYDEVPENVVEAARTLGKLLAERGCAVVTGGNGGLMTVVAEAAFEAGGTTIGILARELEDLPQDNKWFNPYNSIRIKTGMTFTARSSIVVRSSDAVILVAGGVGSLTEVAIAYNLGKPIIVLEGTGMMADRLKTLFPDGALDHRKTTRVSYAKTPHEAAEMAVRMGMAALEGGKR